MSVTLANENIMSYMTSGTHGSTFGGNALACAIAKRTLEVIQEEKLVDNAKKMGEKFRSDLQCKLPKGIVPVIRGKGLMNAIEIHPDFGTGHELSVKLMQCGLLAKSASKQAVRLTPPLVVSQAELEEGIEIITKAVHSFAK